MKILTTLLFPTTGEVRVAGFDAVQKPRECGRRISLVIGRRATRGYGILTVRESLWMFSQFYGVPTREIARAERAARRREPAREGRRAGEPPVDRRSEQR
jgi:ABC-2 type transport system ATP-binding protein